MKEKQKKDIVKNIPLEGAAVSIDNGVVHVKGEKEELSRNFFDPEISITLEENSIKITSVKKTRNQKKKINTIAAHIKNMIQGVSEPFTYKMKACSKHFPMNVSFKNSVLEVKNFLGEKVPRTLQVKGGVDVKVQGEIITIVSADKEKAGQTAGAVEQLCRIPKKDKRIFQDGIYIIEKAK